MPPKKKQDEIVVPLTTNGGARAGAGRKSAKEEAQMALNLKPYREEVIEKILQTMRSNGPKAYDAAKLLFAYMHGQPATSTTTTSNINIDQTITSFDIKAMLEFTKPEVIDIATIEVDDDKNNKDD